MHMSDVLVSPAVAAGAGIIAAALIGVAASKVKQRRRDDIIPLMEEDCSRPRHSFC